MCHPETLIPLRIDSTKCSNTPKQFLGGSGLKGSTAK